MPQSIILKRSALHGKVPTTSSLNLGEIAINTYDGKLYLNRSGSVQSIQEIITTNVVNTGSITLTQTGSFGELVVSQDGNFLRDIYVTQDIIGNGSIDILYDVTASAFLGRIRATNGVISSSAQLTSLNSFTASAGIRLTNLETTSASLLIETQNLELFSASALNRLTNLEIKTGSYATTGSNTFIGNQIVSGSITTSGSVSIVASGSNVFTVDGTSGRLFSIDDSLSGSLFSVNTAAGLPVIEAFSDNTIRIGQFGQRALFVSQSRVGIGKESGLNATLDVSGSAIFSGSLSVSGQFTASLQSGFALVGGPNNTSIAVATSSFAAGGTSGTASWANNAVSSSYPFRVTGSGSFSIYSANAGEGTNNDFSYFIGYKAGLSASNSTYATYIGDFAGAIDNGSPTYAHAGVMVGSDAGYNANNSFLGVYIGNRAGMNATNASQSVFIGTQAGESGSQAANSVMIGGGAGLFASQSMGAIFMGASAGARAAGAYETVAIGYTAGGIVSNTYASNAFRSVFIGSGAGGAATNASNTIALGYGSGQQATNASSSVFIGNQAGVSNSNASFSNFIGYRAGFNGGSLLGQNNTIIGTNITLPAGYSNYANIGSVLFISGTYSTITGNPTQNVSNGRVGINVINPTLGMLQVGGNVHAESFTGSLFGTASWANNVVSASFASTSSVALRGLITASVAGATITFTKGDSTTFDLTIAQSGTVATASYVTSSGVFGPFGSNSILSASFALTASFAPNYVLNSTTSSFATTGSNSFVGNQIITGSLILSGSSSTSLLSTNADTILITGSAIITGSFVVTGSFQLSGSARITNGLVVTGSSAIVGDVSTGNTVTIGGATNTAGVLNFFNGNVGISRSGASGLLFRVGTNQTAATITQEKLVGIGIESPTALLHVSGTTGGLFEIDSVTVPNILYVSSSGNIGVGTITPSASLHILGTNTAATYSLWVQNSSGQTLISTQNDRTVNINSTNAVGGNTNIGTTNGTINFNQGYNNTFTGNALTFYSGGARSTIQGFNDSPGIAIGYAQTTINPNPGTGLSIRGIAALSGSAVLFVTGSSNTRLLALASETNPNTFVVSGSGRVGINQPNPEFNFDVSGSSRFAGNMVITGSISVSGSSPLLQLGSTVYVGDFTNPVVTIGSTSNGIYLDNNRILFKAGGSFAGGFSSDGYIAGQVQIQGNTPNNLTTAMYIPYRLNAIGLLGGLGGNSAGDITLITSGSARLFVSSSGNIGIGTNTPSTLLHISGSTGGFRINNSEFHNTSSLTTSGTTTISQLATGSYISAFYNYSIISASNARAGQIMSIWSGSTATYTEVTTTDIGNTSPASFAVNVVGSNVQLNFTAPGTWTVRTIANLL